MNNFEILAAIDAELARLEQVRVLLTENAAPLKRGKSSRKGGSPKPSKMSAEGRARIARSAKGEEGEGDELTGINQQQIGGFTTSRIRLSPRRANHDPCSIGGP